MKTETINAVALKRELQKKAEQKLMQLTEKEQIKMLRQKYGQVRPKTKRKVLNKPAKDTLPSG
ncbi:MAG: hypothetical protein HYU84_11480 [Chloroflexi bacterium]|nr:hypothetical protein [Chloroflexota bacterium]MBI3168931.1 hypothetical protein [Chloroflexota bacterium]